MLKVAIILPYKENFSENHSGAVSLWVKDYYKFSRFKNNTSIFGSTKYLPFKNKNYSNIKINSLNSRIFSSTNEYKNKVLEILKKKRFDIIEIHNRPVVLLGLIDKIKSKFIIYLHNDPRSMRGTKTPRERINLLNKVDKIIFISMWVKEKFFEDLNISINHNKCEVIYHSINTNKKIVKKDKNIIYVGKLNESKGYDIFCEAINKFLNKNKDWRAFSLGEEKRLKNFPSHKNHFNLGQVSNSKVLSFLNKSAIAVIPSRWEEPFGRTALEATSRGCATIVSNRGGLTETSDEVIILKKLDSYNLILELNRLVKDQKLIKNIQDKSRKNVKHILSENSIKIDNVRDSLYPLYKINYNRNKLKILNIYNLGQKINHRIYHISLGKKLTNGFVRNGHDVLEISDRDYIRQNRKFNFDNTKNLFQNYLINTFKNYNPNLVIFGHTDNVNLDTLDNFKMINRNLIISQWNEDPIIKGVKNSSTNLMNIKKYKSNVDHTFITTDPTEIKKRNIDISNVHFLITPVDKNIERFNIYDLNPKNDLFYAMSHGVNRGTLKSGKNDDRSNFLKEIINKVDNLNYDFYGFKNIEPIWGEVFFEALINSKMGLNLSRGAPTKHYSSNRIATLMGNGLLTFIDAKTKFDDFFKKDEIILYKNLNDLVDKIEFYKNNENSRKKIAKNGQLKYFELFNEKRVSKYIIDKSLGKKTSLF